MSTIEHDTIVLQGNVNLQPKEYNSNIRMNIYQNCVEKYNGKILEIDGNYGVIVRVKNIKQNTINTINNRNSNVSSMRTYFNMVVTLFLPLVDSAIECTITSINNDYIEASVNLTNKVIVVIFIDESNINHDEIKIDNYNVINKKNNIPVAIGTSILCKCITIMPNVPELVIFGNIEKVL